MKKDDGCTCRMRSPQLSPNSISALGLSGHAVAASARTAHSRIRQGGRLLLGSVGRVTVAGFSITAQLPIDGRWDALDVALSFCRRMASFPVSGFTLPEILIFQLGRAVELKCLAVPSRWN